MAPTQEKDKGKWDCCVCLETLFEKKLAGLPCSHFIHSECAEQWVKKSSSISHCPICRMVVTKETIDWDSLAFTGFKDGNGSKGASSSWAWGTKRNGGTPDVELIGLKAGNRTLRGDEVQLIGFKAGKSRKATTGKPNGARRASH